MASEDAAIPSPGTGALRIEPAAAKLASETAGALPLLPWPVADGASSLSSPASDVAGPVSGMAGALGAGRGAGAVKEGEAGGGPERTPGWR